MNAHPLDTFLRKGDNAKAIETMKLYFLLSYSFHNQLPVLLVLCSKMRKLCVCVCDQRAGFFLADMDTELVLCVLPLSHDGNL